MPSEAKGDPAPREEAKGAGDASGWSPAARLTRPDRPPLDKVVLKFTTLSDGQEQSVFTVGRAGNFSRIVRYLFGHLLFSPLLWNNMFF